MDLLEDGIAQANKLPYGLASYGCTHSTANLDRMVEGMETGNRSINWLEASLPPPVGDGEMERLRP